MQMPEIHDRIERTIHFDGVIREAGNKADAISVALENIDVSYADQIDTMNHIVVIFADNKESLDERTSELFSHIEEKSLNVIYSHAKGEEEVNGYSIRDRKDAFKRHYENTVNYGGQSLWSNETSMIFQELPANFIEAEDEEGRNVVIFFNTHDDLFKGLSEEDKEVYADDYALNTSTSHYDIDEEITAYGDMIVLNRSCASELVQLN